MVVIAAMVASVAHRKVPLSRLAYISKDTKNDTQYTKWQYCLHVESYKIESHNAFELLRQLADNIKADSLKLKGFHHQRGNSMQAREITSLSNPYSYCTSIMASHQGSRPSSFQSPWMTHHCSTANTLSKIPSKIPSKILSKISCVVSPTDGA